MNTVRYVRLAGMVSGQDQARREVAKAVSAGTLTRPNEQLCADCGARAEVYDHRDYNKPLDVVAVCRSCNTKRGAAKPLDNPPLYQVERATASEELPSTVHIALVEACASYRQAVKTAWSIRKSQRMTQATLSEITGIFPAHVSDYLSDNSVTPKGFERRDMPAKYIKEFERAVGNTLVSQWIAYQSGLVVA